MAIVRTKPFLLVGVLEKQKEILEQMQKLGCSQIEKVKEDKNLKIEPNLKKIEETKKILEKALKVVEKKLNSKQQKYEQEKKIEEFSKIKWVAENKTKIEENAKEIIAISKEIKQIEKKIETIKNKKILLENYKSLDCPLKNIETKNTKIIFGEILGEFEEYALKEKFKELNDLLYFKIIEKTKTKTFISLVIYKDAIKKSEKILSNISLVKTNIETKNPPKEEILILTEQIEKFKQEILNLDKKIKKNIHKIYDIKILIDFLNIEHEKFKTIKKIMQTNNTFILKGFLNPKFEESLKNIVKNKYNSYIEVFKETENSPVFFKNNMFVSPVETITKTYSMPSFKDIDPNPIMSFFYYMFFGMMFSDAGYGLILTIGCLFFLMVKKEKKDFFRMFLFCGLSTTFWGFMYGSLFGDLTSIISKKFLNSNMALNPIWINTTEKPLLLLIFSISVGILQVVVGILIKTYSLIKQKETKEAIFNNLNWVLTLVGIGFLLANSILKILFLNYIGLFLAVIGFGLTLFFSGYKEKGIMKILKGIINLYGITSYISDILSYSRLMALGIATGVIANVVNILANMGGNGAFGTILFILILVVGHTLNFSINILGAYVHTNRLQYVEFFSKFYTGGGKNFRPFSVKTKYFKFTEKNKN